MHKNAITSLAKVKATNYYKLGLCANEFNTEDGLGLRSSAEIHAMAKLSADFVSQYEGAQIAGINVGFCATVSNITVFIRETATGANLASKNISSTTKGWNQVIFDTPLTLERKNYYIGYHIPVLPQATYAIGYTPESEATQNAMLLSINNGELEDYTGYFGALTVQMLLSGSDEIFSNKAKISEVRMAKHQPINAVVDVPVKIRNIGINTITSIDITYTLGTNAPVQQSFTLNAPVGSAEQTVTLKDVTMNMGGNFTVAITKINGVDISGTPVTMRIKTYEPTTTVERKILLEQFTTEQCGNCPSGTARIKSVIDQAEFAGKVIWVAHHTGFYTDNYTIPASESYLRFFGEGGGSFAPAMMLDRTIFTGTVPVMQVFTDVTQIANTFRQALNIPTTTSVAITQANTVDVNRKVKITVSGNDNSSTLPTEDLYVYIFLLENGITSTTQGGADGTFTHNNLIRSVMNGVGGTKITWDENNRFEVTAEATLTPGWNAQKMDVVAFVASSYQNPLNDTEVLNAVKEKLVINSFSAVENVYGETIHAYSKNGTIVVDGEYTSISIYSIDGKEFSNNNLPKGVYIVKLENKGQNAVKKVIVK
ncbi:MAG TPA: Omp28-related outer membrane protein [Bacteroidales bacterium]|nr:Omp28-related outer membrane protein [Bacteroidales bacterium]